MQAKKGGWTNQQAMRGLRGCEERAELVSVGSSY